MQPAQGLGKTAGGDWDLPLILQDTATLGSEQDERHIRARSSPIESAGLNRIVAATPESGFAHGQWKTAEARCAMMHCMEVGSSHMAQPGMSWATHGCNAANRGA